MNTNHLTITNLRALLQKIHNILLKLSVEQLVVKELGRCCVGSVQPRDESEMEQFVKSASHKGVEVLCFPAGFLQSEDSLERLCRLTRQYGVWVVSGYHEFNDGKKYASSLIIDDSGNIIGKHRMTYLSNHDIREGCTAGDKLEVFKTKYGKFGVVICAEILCPEVTRTLTLKGAELVFHTIGSGMVSQEQYNLWKGMIQVRAIENLLYFVSSTHNRIHPLGGLGTPLGLIVNPGGQVLAEAKKDNLIYAFIDSKKRDDDARKGAPFHRSFANMLSRRQHGLYSVLCT
jgi:predicted amidohydrolase